MGLEAPSPASLARIFRQEGVARAEPSKRPRAAWRRFDLPRPQRRSSLLVWCSSGQVVMGGQGGAAAGAGAVVGLEHVGQAAQ